MNFKKRCFLALILLVIPGALVSLATAGNDVVAKIGGIPVTEYEVARETQKIMPMNSTFHGGISEEKIREIREKSLDMLVEQAYKVRFALDEELSVENTAVEETVSRIRSQYEDEKTFLAAFGGEGVDGYRASVYRVLLAARAEDVAVNSKINITEADLSKYYELNKAMYMRPKQFKASHILIRVDPASNREERLAFEERAKALTLRAQKGEDFYDLAYYNSDDRSKFVGGDLGFFHEGQTVKEFENALLKMKPGDVVGPIQTLHGYHVIKLVEINEARQLGFDEVKVKIRELLEKKEKDRLYSDWMEGLKSKYVLERLK